MEKVKLSEIDENDSNPAEAKPHTLTVLGFLVTSAATFSYLGAYAATDALAKVRVIRPIPRDHDPRLLWAAISFAGIMTLFLIGAMLMRHLSARQFQRIDRMTEEDSA